MGKLALLFPGQASQAVGMGVELRAASARARAIFDLADRVTGLPVTRLCEEGPLERLTATDVAQPAVVTTSLAALAVLRESLGDALQPAATAGHSVGEIAAYVAAGALDEEQALHLVRARSQAMVVACEAANGTMAAVLSLDEEPLRTVCEEASGPDGTVEVANLNAPGQLVISGSRDAVARASELARAAGARRVLPLTVGGPFHSQYMRAAADVLAGAVADTRFSPARVPVAANVDARLIQAPEDLANELVMQVSAPVRWIDALNALRALGCDAFLEVGPGNVVAGLVKRTLGDVRIGSFGAPGDLEAARSVVGG